MGVIESGPSVRTGQGLAKLNLIFSGDLISVSGLATAVKPTKLGPIAIPHQKQRARPVVFC